MSSKYEEISTNLVSIMLEMVDITEKFNKMGTKEIDAMIASALATSKRTNSTMKKILELDTMISTLRQSITKANLQAMMAPKEDEDPKVEEKPKEEEKSKEEVKEEEKKSKGRSKEIPVSEAPKEEPKVEQEVEEKKKGGKKKKEEAPKEQPKVKVQPETSAAEEKKKGGKKKKEDIVKEETPNVEVLKEESPKVEESAKKENDEEKEPLHIRRKNIPKHVKTLVWGKFIGNDKPIAKCSSCRHENIDIRNFHCGHVIAESKGGTCTLDNLRPICAPCNGSMGVMSMNEFTTKYFGWSV
jgi:hypothetical protein